EKIMDLQNKLILGIAPQPIVPAPVTYNDIGHPSAQAAAIKAGLVSLPPAPPVPQTCDPSKFQCGLCGKQLLSISGLQRHLQFKHDKKFVIKGQELVPVL